MKQALVLTALLAASSAFAQTAIDQNRALAGSVTPGDAPGFPVTLSQPGSYKLTGNLTVPMGVKGIVITADEVTLDLNGFTVKGPSSCTRDNATRVVACSYQSEQSIGIDASASEGAEVRNGTVKGFGGVGLSLGRLGRYGNLRLTQSRFGASYSETGPGLTALLANPGNTFSHSLFDTNLLSGVAMYVGFVTNSRAVNNGDNGFQGGSRNFVVAESQARGNRNSGLHAGTARSTQATDNGNNVFATDSMGGNMNGTTPF